MNLSHISTVLAEASALPTGNEKGMRVSLPGVLAHAQRALVEMLEPLDNVPKHIAEQIEDRIQDTQPGFHAHGLEMLGAHIGLLKTAIETGDAKTVRQFFDLYVFD